MHKKKIIFIIIGIILLGIFGLYYPIKSEYKQDQDIIYHIVEPKIQELEFFWKNDSGTNIRNFENLKNWLNSKKIELVFAMNGGMFNKNLSPQGLYIENGKVLAKLDTLKNGYGNFYLQPNGIFCLTRDNKAIICKTTDFSNKSNIKFATQSGPLLVIDGKIHPKLTEGSKNLHIRNGVGILPNGTIIFALSKQKINFYDFATFFKIKGCKNALYLDGFVSRIYLPSQNWVQTNCEFGVIIGEIRKKP